MDLHAIWQGISNLIGEVPQSNLLIITVAAVAGSMIGTSARIFAVQS